MSLRESALILIGWLVLCVGSGSLLTLVAKALPA